MNRRPYHLEQLALRVQQLRQSEPLFLDTETTAKERERGELVEIAIVDLAGRVLLDTLVKPLGSIAAEAQQVHGITPTQLAPYPTWSHYHGQVQSLLFGRHVVAYNAPFDQKAVVHSCALHSLPEPMTAQWHDLMRLYAAWHGTWLPSRRSYRWHSLRAAVEQCGLAGEINYHRARGDAEAARRVFLYLAEQIETGVLGMEMLCSVEAGGAAALTQ